MTFRGSQYLFMAIDSKSKLIICYVIGQRTSSNTYASFERFKAARDRQRIQLSTDGFEAYKIAVPHTIGKDVDFAQVVKLFASRKDADRTEVRYSPKLVALVHVFYVRRGNPKS